ncbi:hypothetical protein SRB17_80060 [Streptomyces sp. RB17]|uniref:TetR/AcrR family transcriptional regulator n=1 Tax=Streptomyces sp. RB17 TaxID=2585197 RepID=UPI0013067725|nr:TetR/AcrR family transcriptional regulator [Streptomyces sp. RB17]MQY39977.1 hypothetical protein [Streptomyces sp. RB17]
MGPMETNVVSRVSLREEQRADAIIAAAGRVFLAPGFTGVRMSDLARELGMSKKTIYRHFPDKRSLLAAVLDRQLTAVEQTLLEAVEDAEGQPFDVRIQRFLIAAGSELGRIGAAQLAAGQGDVMLREYVEQRVETAVYRRLDELFRDGHRQGLVPVPPELISEITRGALERLIASRLPHELGWTAADLLRATVETVLYGAVRPSRAGTDDGQRRAASSTPNEGEQESLA